MYKKLSLLVISIISFSCHKTADSEVSTTSNNAKPIYNEAYQENYEADKISDILIRANHAYVLVDPFVDNVSASVSAIKANNNEVGAYISIGTIENFRDDYDALKLYSVAKPWEEWPNEYFVNSTTTGIIDVMKARIDRIAAWGCDWVEFDNMDWIYDADARTTYGFQVTEAEGIAYYQALCDHVHQKGMKCMAKNTVENAAAFDGVLYESYPDDKNWWDQSGAQSFLDAGKLVIVNHYNETNCGQVYADYKGIYNDHLSFICEDANLKKYVHFNQ